MDFQQCVCVRHQYLLTLSDSYTSRRVSSSGLCFARSEHPNGAALKKYMSLFVDEAVFDFLGLKSNVLTVTFKNLNSELAQAALTLLVVQELSIVVALLCIGLCFS